MSNVVQGEGDFVCFIDFLRCFINFLPKMSEKALNTNISPLTVIYGNDAGFEI